MFKHFVMTLPSVYAAKILKAAHNQTQFGIGVVPSLPVLAVKFQS